MIDVAIFIPAQESNRYHEFGDIAPFGDTTLLNWKISQCKEFVPSNQIYISSDSLKIEEISQREGVNYIKRGADCKTINDQLKAFSNYVNYNNILWTNVTAPFLGSQEYLLMLESFSLNKDCDLIISTVEKHEYVFFNGKKLNFQGFAPREKVESVNIFTNGAYLIDKKSLQDQNDISNIDDVCFYNLDAISSIEVKDIYSYSIAQSLIAVYFSRLLEKSNV
jgi:CMP-N-acetylneuraminic acid synthetase